MPFARSKAFFASFLWPPGQKEWRLAGRDPPVMLWLLKRFKRNRLKIFCSQAYDKEFNETHFSIRKKTHMRTKVRFVKKLKATWKQAAFLLTDKLRALKHTAVSDQVGQ
jgi:hypothetical protein